jgi:hypothetical protein
MVDASSIGEDIVRAGSRKSERHRRVSSMQVTGAGCYAILLLRLNLYRNLNHIKAMARFDMDCNCKRCELRMASFGKSRFGPLMIQHQVMSGKYADQSVA